MRRSPDDHEPSEGVPRRLGAVVAGLLALPLLIGAVVALTRDWYPAMDWALIELRIRDVGSGNTPLLGPFSRYGWNHPGPLMFWIFAPAYRLMGSSSGAILAAGALWNAAMLAGLVMLARRCGGTAMMLLMGAALALLSASLGGEVLVDPWNPWVSLLPFAMLLLATWGVVRGDLVLVVLMVAAGSFLVQTHVGYGALVGALGAWALAFVIIAAVRARSGTDWPQHRRRLVRVGGASALVAVVLWSGPIIDQLANDPGNMRSIASYFLTNEEPSVGQREAATVVGRSLAPLAPWFGGPEPQSIFTAELEETSPLLALPVLAAFALATLVAWRRRDSSALSLAGVVAVGLAIGTLALTRITGEAYYYIVRWWWVLAMFTWVSIAWSLGRALWPRLRDQMPSAPRLAAALSVVVIVGAGVATTVSAVSPPRTDTNNEAVAELRDPVLDAIDPDGTYAVTSAGFSWFEAMFGLVNQLDAEGVDIVAAQRFRTHLGPGRTPDLAATEIDGTLVVAVGDAVVDLADDPSLELVAEYDPLSPNERAELEELQRSAIEQLTAAGREDLIERVGDGGLQYVLGDEPDLQLDLPEGGAERITDLLWVGNRVAVFLGPPPEA